jgi:Mrp family chromosome partitioning ATPase
MNYRVIVIDPPPATAAELEAAINQAVPPGMVLVSLSFMPDGSAVLVLSPR